MLGKLCVHTRGQGNIYSYLRFVLQMDPLYDIQVATHIKGTFSEASVCLTLAGFNVSRRLCVPAHEGNWMCYVSRGPLVPPVIVIVLSKKETFLKSATCSDSSIVHD